jgi:hypothetical protein
MSGVSVSKRCSSCPTQRCNKARVYLFRRRAPPPCSFDSDSQWRKIHYTNLPLVITSQPPQASGISSIAHLNGRHEASQGTEQLEIPHPTNICACGIGVYLDVCIACSEGKDACSDACSDGGSDGRFDGKDACFLGSKRHDMWRQGGSR